MNEQKVMVTLPKKEYDHLKTGADADIVVRIDTFNRYNGWTSELFAANKKDANRYFERRERKLKKDATFYARVYKTVFVNHPVLKFLFGRKINKIKKECFNDDKKTANNA